MKIYPVFSSKSFMILALIFRSLILKLLCKSVKKEDEICTYINFYNYKLSVHIFSLFLSVYVCMCSVCVCVCVCVCMNFYLGFVAFSLKTSVSLRCLKGGSISNDSFLTFLRISLSSFFF